MTAYRTATLTPPSAPSPWSVLRARALRWYWTRFASSTDYQRAEVREAIGGEWERRDFFAIAADYIGRGVPAPWSVGEAIQGIADHHRGDLWWWPKRSTATTSPTT
jgi:hypothetical protein